MNLDEKILYQVAFKGAVELVASGVIELDTEDWAAEIEAIATPFFDVLVTKTEASSGKGDKGKSSKKSSRRSSKPDSGRSGRSDIKPKNPDEEASDAQIRFLKKLLKENDVESDRDGFELDGEEYYFDDFTKGSIQTPIEYLKE